jgi:hypothetical protein
MFQPQLWMVHHSCHVHLDWAHMNETLIGRQGRYALNYTNRETSNTTAPSATVFTIRTVDYGRSRQQRTSKVGTVHSHDCSTSALSATRVSAGVSTSNRLKFRYCPWHAQQYQHFGDGVHYRILWDDYSIILAARLSTSPCLNASSH